MNKSKLITQGEYLDGMRSKELLSQEPSMRFSNGFYVKGKYNHSEVFSTITKRNYNEFRKLLREQNAPQLNQGEDK